MPYIIRPGRLPARALAACGLLLALGAGSAQAEITPSSRCVEPTLSQPFLYAGDTNFYTLLPGEAPNSFGGQGWSLSGGASIESTTLADGSTGSVLDLPSGSKAISPSLCVTSEYPTARTMVRDVSGSQGASVSVSYLGTPTRGRPKYAGQVNGNGNDWTLSTPVNTQPDDVPGWQVLRLVLRGGGAGSEVQLYNLYVDPYKR
jgi:hypothetical protein